ncbi:hypothetical protein C8R46DRAFT_1135466 [Mycena filopes]|nr:hypothetical protein C8R46DRAFT_1135466 [Mycena filopes]
MPALDSTLGAVEIGTMLSIFLFGIVTVQAAAYYRNFPQDSWTTKALVSLIWIVELVHTALTCASTYHKTITSFGKAQELTVLDPAFNFSIAFVAVVGPVVQAFYAYRILRLSHNHVVPIICWLLSLFRFVNLLGIAIASFVVGDLIEFKARFSWLVVTSLAISAFTDVLITGTTCYFLRAQSESRHQFQRTKRMIDLMILWTIQTGLLTSITSVVMLICFLSMDNLVWVAILFLVSRSFANSLLSTLNSRTAIREVGRGTDHFASGSSSSRPRHAPGTILIEMSRSQVHDRDLDSEPRDRKQLEVADV